MKATQLLHKFGQSLWLDNIARDLLDSGTLNHDSSTNYLIRRYRRMKEEL